ncbi:hypothetical protein B0H16DRAFT_451231 [Mycena metata]|uniref:Uncharacterized protein n=1 Tax=Mycena metata TaxID=1033252 RepID=A0AAD7MGV2_9AGAR|nr:hypothetical protein B0H16DRAFT_451231 [Mycena metata]
MLLHRPRNPRTCIRRGASLFLLLLEQYAHSDDAHDHTDTPKAKALPASSSALQNDVEKHDHADAEEGRKNEGSEDRWLGTARYDAGVVRTGGTRHRARTQHNTRARRPLPSHSPSPTPHSHTSSSLGLALAQHGARRHRSSRSPARPLPFPPLQSRCPPDASKDTPPLARACPLPLAYFGLDEHARPRRRPTRPRLRQRPQPSTPASPPRTDGCTSTSRSRYRGRYLGVWERFSVGWVVSLFPFSFLVVREGEQEGVREREASFVGERATLPD